jgi:hypothetical protein
VRSSRGALAPRPLHGARSFTWCRSRRPRKNQDHLAGSRKFSRPARSCTRHRTNKGSSRRILIAAAHARLPDGAGVPAARGSVARACIARVICNGPPGKAHRRLPTRGIAGGNACSASARADLNDPRTAPTRAAGSDARAAAWVGIASPASRRVARRVDALARGAPVGEQPNHQNPAAREHPCHPARRTRD